MRNDQVDENPGHLWILCPSYLDVESFLILRTEVLGFIRQEIDDPFRSIRFAVVDDTAGMDVEIKKLAPLGDVTVIVPPFNLGHQRAIVYGLRYLADQIHDDDFLVTLDSDGEDQARDFPRLLSRLLQEPKNLRKVVLAQRTKRREALSFKVFYFFFRIFFQALTGSLIRTGNFAAYRGWLAKNVLFHPHFDLCYSSSFLSLGLAIDTVPCERGRRYAGQSRMNYFKLIMHGIRMLMPFIDRIAVRALIGFFWDFRRRCIGFCNCRRIQHDFPSGGFGLAIIFNYSLR